VRTASSRITELETRLARLEAVVEAEAQTLTRTIQQIYGVAQSLSVFATNAESAIIALSHRLARVERIAIVRLANIQPGDQN
jgi:hypothetical protein